APAPRAPAIGPSPPSPSTRSRSPSPDPRRRARAPGRLLSALLLAWALCPTPAAAAPPAPQSPTHIPLAWFLPWEKRPPHVHWLITFGPAVSFFTEPPPGAANVFIGLRLGIGLASRGHHHVSATEGSWTSELGRRSY